MLSTTVENLKLLHMLNKVELYDIYLVIKSKTSFYCFYLKL